jgi:putative membrane protein
LFGVQGIGNLGRALLSNCHRALRALAEVAMADAHPNQTHTLPGADFQPPADVSQAPIAASDPDGAGPFLVQAMEDSLATMELCMIALDNAGSGDVQNLAQVMISEHGKLGQQIEMLAQRMQVPFPKKIRPEHIALINRLAGLQGDAFDRQFLAHNLRYHQNDLKVFAHYAAQQDGGAVRELAEAGVRVFEAQLKLVQDLVQQMKL